MHSMTHLMMHSAIHSLMDWQIPLAAGTQLESGSRLHLKTQWARLSESEQESDPGR